VNSVEEPAVTARESGLAGGSEDALGVVVELEF
jgi:hypothetical protein